MVYKRRRRPRRRAPKRRSRVPRTLTIKKSPVPDKLICNLRYVGGLDLDPSTTGNAVSHALRANSCWDPYVPTGGHQPIGFDNWMSMYSTGVVLSSKITARFITQSGTFTGRQALCGILTSSLSTTIPTTDAHLEDGKCVYSYMSDKRDQVKLSRSFNAKRYFGLKDIQDDEDYRFYNTGDCVNQAYFMVFAQAPVRETGTGYLDPGLITVQYQIDYKVQFSERRVMLGS